MTKIEFVLQHKNGDNWIDVTPPDKNLQPVVDFALVIRDTSPATEQRIVRRVTEILDEVFITEI